MRPSKEIQTKILIIGMGDMVEPSWLIVNLVNALAGPTKRNNGDLWEDVSLQSLYGVPTGFKLGRLSAGSYLSE